MIRLPNWLRPGAAERDELAARCQQLQQDLDAAHADLAILTAEREQARKARQDGRDVDSLSVRLAEAEQENRRLRMAVQSGGPQELLLREQATNRRLSEQVHRLTQANIAADRGWR